MRHTSELRVGAVLYLVGSTEAHGVLVTPEDRREPFTIGRCADLHPHVASLLAALTTPVPRRARDREFARFTDGWGPALLPPNLSSIDLDVLVAIPHHFLHAIPLHAVRFAGAHLVEQLAVVYAPSVALFEHAVGHNPIRALGPWAFADRPDEDTSTLLAGPSRFCTSYGEDVLDGRKRYAEVAAQFAAAFGERKVIHADAPVRGSLKSRSPDSVNDVVCAVCHGFVDTVAPELSGLLVSSGLPSVFHRLHLELTDEIAFQIRDYPFRFPPAELPIGREPVEVLTALEIATAERQVTELACLFGCSTARGEALAFDEVSTVAHQWLKTGAGSVLASLWKLDVEMLASWVPRFLANWLMRRQPKAIAWQHATRSLMDDEPDVPPAEWAVLALLGDWL
jgi:CHAT domain-containing protein